MGFRILRCLSWQKRHPPRSHLQRRLLPRSANAILRHLRPITLRVLLLSVVCVLLDVVSFVRNFRSARFGMRGSRAGRWVSLLVPSTIGAASLAPAHGGSTV
eukprot:3498947-Pleurochrysis_carterae.AAC.4